ncbi:helix-turn-helix domain-containing protein [Novosphingobium sp. FGD1]|uniref:Helix-turn-helix domain-containing protein n=1 Tax=Novosphingobium silvae TaxID=2692619 RepID=A0A7X4GF77_9SPHN|nr:helix-turn-helix domain-containing protein [Novosphingobium silvae]MYL96449.1 helix-turn-helix domain-containing protein [Novosphingobium silvae]
MSGDRAGNGLWRRSYDVDDARAQVSTIYWEPTPKKENFHRFTDVYRDTVEAYADHVREHGKTLPISQNALRVLRALFGVMDGKTGRCDPSLDEISKRSRLSRRTVVRMLETLREHRIVDWVRRTVKTGNAKGEGPQRQQTSNAYFIDMVKLPIEIVRTLRQKLGGKLREKVRHLEGSGAVPNRMAIKAERLLKSLTGSLSAGVGREHSERRALASGTATSRLAHMYGGDIDAMRQHEEMLGLSSVPSASANLALYPRLQTLKEKD